MSAISWDVCSLISDGFTTTALPRRHTQPSCSSRAPTQTLMRDAGRGGSHLRRWPRSAAAWPARRGNSRLRSPAPPPAARGWHTPRPGASGGSFSPAEEPPTKAASPRSGPAPPAPPWSRGCRRCDRTATARNGDGWKGAQLPPPDRGNLGRREP